MSIGSEQAFPNAPYGDDPGEYGMSYRQWLAGLAMQGMISACRPESGAEAKLIVECAVKISDALIAELAKNGGV